MTDEVVVDSASTSSGPTFDQMLSNVKQTVAAEQAKPVVEGKTEDVATTEGKDEVVTAQDEGTTEKPAPKPDSSTTGSTLTEKQREVATQLGMTDDDLAALGDRAGKALDSAGKRLGKATSKAGRAKEEADKLKADYEAKLAALEKTPPAKADDDDLTAGEKPADDLAALAKELEGDVTEDELIAEGGVAKFNALRRGILAALKNGSDPAMVQEVGALKEQLTALTNERKDATEQRKVAEVSKWFKDLDRTKFPAFKDIDYDKVDFEDGESSDQREAIEEVLKNAAALQKAGAELGSKLSLTGALERAVRLLYSDDIERAAEARGKEAVKKRGSQIIPSPRGAQQGGNAKSSEEEALDAVRAKQAELGIR
jgi:hypothetical protein